MIHINRSLRFAALTMVLFISQPLFARAARLWAMSQIQSDDLIIFKNEETKSSLISQPLQDDALPPLLTLAAQRLDATYASWLASSAIPMSRQFPDIMDKESNSWHTESIETFTGAPGLLTSSLWSMFKITGSDLWMDKAMEVTLALASSPTLSDASMGQNIATLAYPTLKIAYEASLTSSAHSQSSQLLLEAALTAASTLARMYVRVPGVIKVRPTADIAAEASSAGVASISPFAVFSSIEGAAAATGLLSWASTLEGGKPVWRDIATRNAKRIAQDHISADGTVQGTLVYSSLSASTPPKVLSSLGASSQSSVSQTSSLSTFVETVMETLTGAQHASSSTTASSSISSGEAMDAWLSSIGGQATSAGLRQAMGTLTMVEAARAASEDEDFTLSLFFIKAAEATALSLLARTSPISAAAFDPLSTSAAAAALAELSTLPSLSADRAQEYSDAARMLVSRLSDVSRDVPSASMLAMQQEEEEQQVDQSLGAVAAKWMSKLLNKVQPSSTSHAESILLPMVGDVAEAEEELIAQEEASLLTVGAEEEEEQQRMEITSEDQEVMESEEQLVHKSSTTSFLTSRSILPHGSMMGDQLLIQALQVITTSASSR